jgi:membrane-associated phospholipid phosphatase
LALMVPGQPVSDAPMVSAPPVPSHTAELYVAPAPPPVTIDYFPSMPITRFFKNSGLALARPFQPHLSDAALIIPAAGLAVIAMRTDIQTYAAVQTLPNPMIAGKRSSFWGSILGEGWFDAGVFLGLAVLGGRDGQRACIAGLQALLAVAVMSEAGKLVFREERPSYDPYHHHLFGRARADSMPSGHTMAAFATASVLAQEWPKLAPVFYLLATYLGLARIQQSTHWASDVVVGAVLGTLLGWESYRLTREYELEVNPWVGGNGGGLSVARRF